MAIHLLSLKIPKYVHFIEDVLSDGSVETTLLNYQTGNVFKLSQVGADFWRQIREERSVDEVAVLLMDHYDAPREQIISDLSDLTQTSGGLRLACKRGPASMKVGLARHARLERQDSLRHVYTLFERAIGSAHEIVLLPLEFRYATVSERDRIANEFVSQCDVIIDGASKAILEARAAHFPSVPMVINLLGALPRAGLTFAPIARHLRSTDLLLASSSADLRLAHKFFQNPNLTLMPFPFDEGLFRPLSESERRSARQQFNIGLDVPLLLYPGRITLEKNLHTLLRIFRVVLTRYPNAHLILAGEVQDHAFHEFGLHVIGLDTTLRKIMTKLGLPQDQVHFLGRVEPHQMRNLYGAADVAINMTLHHDENFGYAQVEAMACGTPVVGSHWGGLRDTIINGVTGYHARTALTPAGVKVDWWEAADKIVFLLNNDALRTQICHQARAHACENYSFSVFEHRLQAALNQAVSHSQGFSSPLKITPFAAELWLRCVSSTAKRADYHRSARSASLYQELIQGYADLADKLGDLDAMILLAQPACLQDDGYVVINDPMYPAVLRVPKGLLIQVAHCLETLSCRPVMQASDLAEAKEALIWLIEQGIVLRSAAQYSDLSPSAAGPEMGKALFSIHMMPPDVDIVAYR